MIESTQCPINHTTSRRRVLETFDPLKGSRLFIKRSSTREEATKDLNSAGTPRDRVEQSFSSLDNEAKAIHFVKTHTSIPVPTIIAVFEDRGCLYMIQEYIENAIPAFDAPDHVHSHIVRQLEHYMSELHNLRSHKFHCFSRDLHLPARLVSTEAYLSTLQYPEDPQCRYVLCHGDLGWQNIMVDPRTGDIKSIIDWEYAGFYPVEVEGEYWKRFGTASPNSSERSDNDKICQLLHSLNTDGRFSSDYHLSPKIDYTNHPEGKHQLDRRKHSKVRYLSSRSRLSSNFKRIFSVIGQKTVIPTSGPQGLEKNEKSLDAGPVNSQDVSDRAQSAVFHDTNQDSLREPNLNLLPSHDEQSSGIQGIIDAPEWHDLKVSHPRDKTITAQSITVQVAIASREHISAQLTSLKRSVDIDYRAGQDWTLATSRDAPGYYIRPLKSKTLVQETLHSQELCRLLSGVLDQLSSKIRLSIDPLKHFQQRQLLAQKYTEEIVKMRSEFDDMSGDPSSLSLDPYWIHADNIRRHIHADRDQAFRESETLKWNAIKAFAHALLVISHAAETLLPFTPDRVRNQPSGTDDPARRAAEDRVRDLLLGGSGGWTSQVTDMQDWVPLNAIEKGVPEEKEEKTEPIPDRILQYYYDSDARYLKSLEQESSGDGLAHPSSSFAI
ncbi:uncharacterized protein I206_104766 [Kwoniella pini CBS 10737]|uniref:Aminoglycoside phosphotransferase domain-containing protein n=1 Tax=Kwoniella pini CBS 10737 TaxID=1296096 RepID=A0A1B9I7X0_9TREE|nr:uncharacterized protein I206_02304 [Kwoniella pini CBS 10737]OCF51589.1 hypothetical protein I206_02304 [Kwoniella pini CBS 10737]